VKYRTTDFDIQVPREMIAQKPADPRDSSRLLVLERQTGVTSPFRFSQLPLLLRRGDCLVFNNSRVIPARLRGHIEGSPMDEVVILLLLKEYGSTWEALVEVGQVQEGDKVSFSNFFGSVQSVMERIGVKGQRLITIWLSDEAKLDLAGEPPVPPYIHGYKGDPERYQGTRRFIVG
jgi:S-adenosylmethionine:tRNA ribosyltransferase-isomerase